MLMWFLPLSSCRLCVCVCVCVFVGTSYHTIYRLPWTICYLFVLLLTCPSTAELKNLVGTILSGQTGSLEQVSRTGGHWRKSVCCFQHIQIYISITIQPVSHDLQCTSAGSLTERHRILSLQYGKKVPKFLQAVWGSQSK